MTARVSIRNVSIKFPVYTAATRSIRTDLFTRLGGKLASHNGTVIVNALNDISLELRDGDRLGLIGTNGAGKTTFLRLVSGVYPPVSGDVEIEGKVSSFTDISLGMDPEATGWQNITFRCIFLGMTLSEAATITPAIAEFSELGEYLDLPVRTYSTGMFVRLAFAISTSIRPDIVVMDEMIGAGDQTFIKKAQQRVTDLLDHARILILASHSENILREFCNKLLWLENGSIKMLDDVETVLASYTRECQ